MLFKSKNSYKISTESVAICEARSILCIKCTRCASIALHIKIFQRSCFRLMCSDILLNWNCWTLCAM